MLKIASKSLRTYAPPSITCVTVAAMTIQTNRRRHVGGFEVERLEGVVPGQAIVSLESVWEHSG